MIWERNLFNKEQMNQVSREARVRDYVNPYLSTAVDVESNSSRDDDDAGAMTCDSVGSYR